MPKGEADALTRPGITWEMIFDWWYLVAADLISEYRLNPYDEAQMSATRWTAFRVMINGLFAADTRVSRKYEYVYGSQQ